MQLIGYLDSPYVRRVAVSMQFLGLAYRHREISIWHDYDEFRAINPLVKVPTLVCDDGAVLVDSGLILDYLEQLADPAFSLVPGDSAARRESLQQTGVALVGMEKSVQLIYERRHRPVGKQHAPWIERLEQQLEGAVQLLEAAVSAAALAGREWLTGERPSQADVTTAIAWAFIRGSTSNAVQAGDFPALEAFSERAEALPEFEACRVD
ncbi:MAG: glutathione S-transferase [Xanthomonadales bacterium]|nr:glutathione S-transferase family protein [Xanthomonadales bacterium]NIX12902.1 glutathione S-transferase [Xanthomonadales bacterium]